MGVGTLDLTHVRTKHLRQVAEAIREELERRENDKDVPAQHAVTPVPVRGPHVPLLYDEHHREQYAHGREG